MTQSQLKADQEISFWESRVQVSSIAKKLVAISIHCYVIPRVPIIRSSSLQKKKVFLHQERRLNIKTIELELKPQNSIYIQS